ncbi:ADP-ribose pyrophosphatase [Desulfohalotomaculum tongense]|uniref:NUDIX domain-containing protein n=1 Tax=Desulforadius tongensis TaxID=1216062 RepID=UPI00195D41D7|nr:NUDIX hydrolase [Desulforadius tongensis]MBM7854158.1 ADP-ribose pyrophosphatase [Desulforadius tongensis]
MMKLTEKTISSQMLHRGKVVSLRIDSVELPNGKIAAREVVEHSGAVAVVPIDNNGEVLMVRQYRHPVGKILLEIPAGKLDPGEAPDDCVRRELLEETGMVAGKLSKLFSCYSTPGFSNEILHVYLAENLTYQGQQLDKDEFLKVEKVPLSKAVEMISAGEIEDAKTIAGLLAVKTRERSGD